ncbi:MAG: hypothetical protein Q4A30_00820 [Candidatus Saccharibacteria bacterium]|nr:hypothetical protein [Candidatus Saccharibacteria bacterium]
MPILATSNYHRLVDDIVNSNSKIYTISVTKSPYPTINGFAIYPLSNSFFRG